MQIVLLAANIHVIINLESEFARACELTETKEQLINSLAARGAKYPAEHNVGRLYVADDAQASFYRSLDPNNVFNPGVGKASKNFGYQ